MGSGRVTPRREEPGRRGRDVLTVDSLSLGSGHLDPRHPLHVGSLCCLWSQEGPGR